MQKYAVKIWSKTVACDAGLRATTNCRPFVFFVLLDYLPSFMLKSIFPNAILF